MMEKCTHVESEKVEQDYSEFRKQLEHDINRHCMENGSDTPDFMLADYLVGCLELFDKTIAAREKWYGRKPGLLANIAESKEEIDPPSNPEVDLNAPPIPFGDPSPVPESQWEEIEKEETQDEIEEKAKGFLESEEEEGKTE